jgi:hypothetical protein
MPTLRFRPPWFDSSGRKPGEVSNNTAVTMQQGVQQQGKRDADNG